MQTRGAWPLRRAFDAVVACDGAGERSRTPRAHRAEFMWPWESEPHSIAHGILDDETYDWLAVVEGMLETGGTPLVVDEATLGRRNALALETTRDRRRSDRLRRSRRAARPPRCGAIGDDERVAVLFTGVIRHHTPEEGTEMRSFLGQGHPVAQGI